MYQQQDRYRRLRLLLKTLNKERKKQAKKIDILCNDLIGAQRDFIRRLNTISSTADFYKSIIGTTDLSQLLNIAGKHIQENITDVNVCFFLRQAIGFELYAAKNNAGATGKDDRFEDYFNAEIVENICKSNRTCEMEDILAMGLQIKPAKLNRTRASTVPLEQFGQSLGFILLYHWSEKGFTQDDLAGVSSITAGLSRAVQACRVLSH
jgi:hypothetical protein